MSDRHPSGGLGPSFDEQMRETLHRHASEAPRLDLAARSLAKARRIRRRRRVATGLAALAVAAVAVPVGTTVLSDPGSSSADVANRAPDSPSSTSSAMASADDGQAAPVTVVSLRELHASRQPPTVPYIHDRTLVQGGSNRSIPEAPVDPYDPTSAQVVDAAAFSDGVGAFVLDPGTGSLALRSTAKPALPRYTATTSPAIDIDGSVAFALSGVRSSFRPPEPSLLVYADTLDGTPRTSPAGSLAVRQVMDVDHGVVVFNATDADGNQVVGRADLADASGSSVEQPWPDVVSVSAVDQSGGLMVGRTATMGTGEHHCSAMLSTDDASELWRTCDWRPTEFSPDGSRVFAVAVDAEGVGQATAILDAHSGKVIREFSTPGRFGRATFESSNALDVVAVDRGRAAIVRCTESGACALATKPEPARPGSLVVPYQLTANP